MSLVAFTRNLYDVKGLSLWRELGTNGQGVHCDLSMNNPPQVVEDLGPNGCNRFEKLKLQEGCAALVKEVHH